MPRHQATQATENPSTNTDADREEQPSQQLIVANSTFKIRLVFPLWLARLISSYLDTRRV
jgi:hypothetical protein